MFKGLRDRTTGGVLVIQGLKEVTPDESQAVWNHSPDGFEWGYHGSGPAQLALALLLASGLATPGDALQWHQDFKDVCVSQMPKWNWELTREEIFAFVQVAPVLSNPLLRGRMANYFAQKWPCRDVALN